MPQPILPPSYALQQGGPDSHAKPLPTHTESPPDQIFGIHWFKHLLFGEFDEDRPLSVVVGTMLICFVPGAVLAVSARDTVALTTRLAKHPERREDTNEWIALIGCVIPLVLPVAIAAVGSVVPMVGTAIGGIAGSELAASLRAVCLLLVSKSAPVLSHIVDQLRPFIKGDILLFLRGINFTKFQEQILKYVGDFLTKLIKIIGEVREELEKLPGGKSLFAILQKLNALQNAFYDLQVSAMNNIPKVLNEMNRRLQAALAQPLPHNPRMAYPGTPAPQSNTMEMSSWWPWKKNQPSAPSPVAPGNKAPPTSAPSPAAKGEPTQQSPNISPKATKPVSEPSVPATVSAPENPGGFTANELAAGQARLVATLPAPPINGASMSEIEVVNYYAKNGSLTNFFELVRSGGLPEPHKSIYQSAKLRSNRTASEGVRRIEGSTASPRSQAPAPASPGPTPVSRASLGNVPYGPKPHAAQVGPPWAALQVPVQKNLHPETLRSKPESEMASNRVLVKDLKEFLGLNANERRRLLEGEPLIFDKATRSAPSNLYPENKYYGGVAPEFNIKRQADFLHFKGGTLFCGCEPIVDDALRVQKFIPFAYVLAQSLRATAVEMFVIERQAGVYSGPGGRWLSTTEYLRQNKFVEVSQLPYATTYPIPPVNTGEFKLWHKSAPPDGIGPYKPNALTASEGFYSHIADESSVPNIIKRGLIPASLSRARTDMADPWVNFGNQGATESALLTRSWDHVKNPVVISIPYSALKERLGFNEITNEYMELLAGEKAFLGSTMYGPYVSPSVILEHNPHLLKYLK